MKAALIALSLILATLAWPARAQSEVEDRRALEALNAAWLNSYVTRDVAALGTILADEFVATYSGGVRRTRAEMLERLATGGSTVLSVQIENLSIQIVNDVAVVTARSVLQVQGENGPTTSRNDYADIYVRRAGSWRAIAAHVVRAPTPR